ncbi:MAG: efflux RND transporter periplasmic adaptor subunit [Deltaproteobacteria bacterium]|jgi:RND family efflux transporter MFP subunit|nr:efflux RND transporter periplasmic adaptor subunit [Deltaproteobacteria bacterium]MBW2482190.1 efflux RND transporter periplasmic adaptor subunit [Deltaproteobacteria bacterium]
MKLSKTIGSKHSLRRKISIFVSLSISMLVIFIGCGKKEEPVAEEIIRPVKTMKVEDGPDSAGLTLPGKVRASQRVELAFKEVGGRLIELPIAGREGQEVKEGELLARIDPRDFQTRLRNVQGRLKEAIASLDLANAEYDRVKRIQEQDPGAISGADIDRKREAVNMMEGRIKSLQAEVAAARDELSYTQLKAPFTGLIAKRYVDNFQEVQPKQAILALEDISHVELLIDVAENVMAVARNEGDDVIQAEAEFPTARGKKFNLEIKEYATRADPATQTYQVVLQMPQPDDISILPGMTATITVSLGRQAARGKAVVIPAIAVLAEPSGQSFVWVVDPKELTVKKQEVKVGMISGSENIDVTEGLEGGETIAVAGILQLQDGMKVRIWEQ